jgi:hypothetical protein
MVLKYLTKPWDPPEEHLYPVLNDILDKGRAIVAKTLFQRSSRAGYY